MIIALKDLLPASHVFRDLGGMVPQSTLELWSPGLQAQLREDFAPEWGVGNGDVVRCDAAPTKPREREIRLLDEPPANEQDALGLHLTTPDGTPILNIFCGLARRCGRSMTPIISHEALEARADALGTQTVVLPDGRTAAVEVCDQVESLSYFKLGVEVSNFNTRLNYGDTSGPSKMFDFLGKQTSAFQVLKGGYAQTFDPSSGWTQIGEGMRLYRAELHRLGLSRAARRARS